MVGLERLQDLVVVTITPGSTDLRPLLAELGVARSTTASTLRGRRVGSLRSGLRLGSGLGLVLDGGGRSLGGGRRLFLGSGRGLRSLRAGGGHWDTGGANLAALALALLLRDRGVFDVAV